MKICFLTHNLREDNGSGVFSARLIKGLSDFETVIFTHQDIVPFSRFVQALKKMRDCDVIHALDAFPYGILAVLAGMLLRKKVMITALGTGAINRLYHPAYSWLLKWSYRRAEKVVAISSFTKQEILKKVPDLTIDVINLGIDFGDFRSATSNFRNNFEGLKPYILSVGTLRWRKGYHVSIRAFKKVSEALPDYNYVIAGKRHSEKYYQKMKMLIQELGLSNKVLIFDDIENRKELTELYKNAELFMLASQNERHDVEGFGLVFLEAAAAGLPVVGPKDSGVEDAAAEGRNGFLVSEQDHDAFAEAIIKILSNPELKRSMSENSLALAQGASWEKMTYRYVEFYKTLANKPA